MQICLVIRFLDLIKFVDWLEENWTSSVACSGRFKLGTTLLWQANEGSDSQSSAIWRVLRPPTVVGHSRTDRMRCTATLTCNYWNLRVANLENMHFPTRFSNFTRRASIMIENWSYWTMQICLLVIRFLELIKFVDWSEENWTSSVACSGRFKLGTTLLWQANGGSDSQSSAIWRVLRPPTRCGTSTSRSDEMYSYTDLQLLEPPRR